MVFQQEEGGLAGLRRDAFYRNVNVRVVFRANIAVRRLAFAGCGIGSTRRYAARPPAGSWLSPSGFLGACTPSYLYAVRYADSRWSGQRL